MCGIIGLVSNSGGVLSLKKRDFIEEMLIMDTLRGWHSTGVAGITHNEILTRKNAIPGWDFVQLRSTDNFLSKIASMNCLIGHNRHATKGAINAINAHPFTCGNITGVHNGSIHNHRSLIDGSSFEVDSEAILHSIDKVGLEKTLRQINGAYSLVYYNEADDTVNFVRNDERPMFFAYIKHDIEKHSTLVYGSDEHMLESAITRQKMKTIDGIQMLPVHTWMKVDISEPDSVKIREITPYTPPKQYHSNRYQNNNSHQRSRRSGNLEKEGLRYGDKLKFCVSDVEMYPANEDCVKINGYTTHSPFYEITVHMARVELWGDVDHNYELEGEVRNVINRVTPQIMIAQDTLKVIKKYSNGASEDKEEKANKEITVLEAEQKKDIPPQKEVLKLKKHLKIVPDGGSPEKKSKSHLH